jgi:hypothetical protein
MVKQSNSYFVTYKRVNKFIHILFFSFSESFSVGNLVEGVCDVGEVAGVKASD